MMQSADDEKETCECTNGVDFDGQQDQIFDKWRRILLRATVACAAAGLLMSLAASLVTDWPAPEGRYMPWLYVLLLPPLGALASFMGAFLCASICCRGIALLHHVGVVVCDAAVMALMYMYCPWIVCDTEPPRIAYAWMWDGPPMEGPMLDGVFLAVGRLSDQYMVVIVLSSILILRLTRGRVPIASEG